MNLAAEIVSQARGAFPNEEKIVVAVSSEGTVVHLGYDLDQTFRGGACVARLLAQGTPQAVEWYLVAIRPDGRKRRFEKEAAERVLSTSRLIDFPLHVALLAVKGRNPVCLSSDKPTEELLAAGLSP